MGARRPFFVIGAHLTQVHVRERELQREISRQVEGALPGVEVLAVELSGPEVLRGYLDRYTVDVSSPGFERPLRKPVHFRGVVGRRVSVRTSQEISGRKRFRGQVLSADDHALSLGAEGGEAVLIPYDEVVRGNLIDEGGTR